MGIGAPNSVPHTCEANEPPPQPQAQYLKAVVIALLMGFMGQELGRLSIEGVSCLIFEFVCLFCFEVVV